MKKRILITGGMGFIGKVLVKKILDKTDYHITIVDNLSSSNVVKKIIDNRRIMFIKKDFSTYKSNTFDRFSQIYHLASPVGPVGILRYKGQIGKIIVEQVYKVAQMSHQMKAKLLDISTSEVYGKHPDDEKVGQRESIDKIVPAKITVRLEYGVAKLLSEIILHNFNLSHPLNYNCVRPFNIVGPGQNDDLGFVIPRFVKQCLTNKPMTVYGDGKQKRTFTHVEDFVDGIFAVMESNIAGEIFNIGNPKNFISILELARKIKKITNSKSQIVLTDPTKLFGKDFAEAWNKIANIDKIRKMIGWKPQWNLNRIINQAAEMKKKYLL